MLTLITQLFMGGATGGLSMISPALIKYGLIFTVALSLFGWYEYDQHQKTELKQEVADVTQQNTILQQNVDKVVEINAGNQKILAFVTKNQQFIQDLEQNNEKQKQADAQARQTLQESIKDKAVQVGDKPLSPLSAYGLNLMNQQDGGTANAQAPATNTTPPK